MTTFLILSLIALTIVQLPEFNRQIDDEPWRTPLRQLDTTLAGIEGPSIVVIDGSHPDSTELMAVYNLEAPWPDDAQLIRANDLGERNVELYRYFAQRHPRRMVYRYDLRDDALRKLGWADELAARP